MSAEVLILYDADNRPHDISRFLLRSGMEGGRNDIDSEKTKRLKNGLMMRDKIGDKRTFSIRLRGSSSDFTREQIAEIDSITSQTFYRAVYMDLHGRLDKTFYTSSFHYTLDEVTEDGETVSGASFEMIER